MESGGAGWGEKPKLARACDLCLMGTYLVYFSFPHLFVYLIGYIPNEVVPDEPDVKALVTLEGVEPFPSDATLIKQ